MVWTRIRKTQLSCSRQPPLMVPAESSTKIVFAPASSRAHSVLEWSFANKAYPDQTAPEELSDQDSYTLPEMNGVDKDKKDTAVVFAPATANGSSRVLDEDHDGKVDTDKKDKKEKEEAKLVGVFQIFKYATKLDVVCMILGTLCAAVNGSAFPLLSILLGELIDVFVNSGKFGYLVDALVGLGLLTDFGLTQGEVIEKPSLLEPFKANITTSGLDYGIVQHAMDYDVLEETRILAIYFTCVGAGIILFGYGQVMFWMLAAERQAHRIRKFFFSNVLRQNIGWFDTQESGQLNSRLSEDINKVHSGIGDKMGHFTQWFSSGIIGFIVGFVYGWKLTLVIIAISPLIFLTGIIESKIVALASGAELKAYARAGAIAEEVLGAIRTVTAFGGQKKETQRYQENLFEARRLGIRKGLYTGLALGLVWLILFAAYALGFWYGGKLSRDEPENYTIGNVTLVFFAVLIGAYSLGTAAPYIQGFSVARGAAYVVYQIIDQEPPIDSSSPAGKKLDSLQGNIEIRALDFKYPSRPDVQVLSGLSLKVNRGQTVALVGSSGCGKSTVVQLIQRFYDPERGQVLIDGIDVRDYNLKWLRQHIGIVSQEPVLFGTTIAENIRYGRDDVTQEEIEAAARKANAHDFIQGLPNKYETLVGERGAQLSGGQKQRIAIARALVRDPKILLLDEATSALDNESEGVVQEALEKASAGRTTIVIAHRLSTIKNADMIYGVKEGRVVEQGTHEELVQRGGIYQQLVTAQTSKTEEDEEAEEYEEEEKHHVLPVAVEEVQVDTGDEKEKKKKEEKSNASFLRILKLNSQEWYLMVLGIIGAAANGCLMPLFAFIFSEIIGVFAETDLDKQSDDIRKFTLFFVLIGVISLITNTLQIYMFGRSGEYLTLRIRLMSFESLLRQDMSYFDNHDNSVGAMTTRLATDASQVQGAAGVRLGTVTMAMCGLTCGVIIGLVYSWKLTLVTVCFLPIIFIGGGLMMTMQTGAAGKNKEALEAAGKFPVIFIGGELMITMQTGAAGKNKEALEAAGKIAVESIENIRTVASLTREETFFKKFMDELATPYKQALRKAHIVAIAFSFSQSVLFFAYATSFYYGAVLVTKNELNFEEVFKVFTAIVFGAMGIGQTSSYAPDAAKAQASAEQIFKLLDSKPTINPDSDEGEKPDKVDSTVTFSSVKFQYPTRAEVQVLDGLDLSVSPGQTVALVGSSGCGKSTTVQLIERFYDISDGQVHLGNHSIQELNVQWLRSKIGIVSQEPILFDRSIADNIAYGDNFRQVPMAEIIAAARKANIHDFIASLPEGYDTNVGEKGAQLSGGQKQRVAIARALVRNPQILLLDEATSALDTESEKVVQEALDKAREGRTCIVIAHRLSTIQNADKICVIRHGTVTEEGTHSDLMKNQGFYYKLNMIQARTK